GLEPDLVQKRFVTKKHITAPTGISVSPQGVVFVSCDINGTTNQRRKAGKVVRCEDTDGDGAADKFSNFVEGIDSPRGSCYVDDTLYLTQPPLLVAYQDPDGDGVAEKKTVLVNNLGQPLHASSAHHGANGIRMGIDGWLYLAIGDQGCFDATGTDGSRATLYGGGVLRVRPDGSQISVLLTGTRNLYDVAVDPYLDLFARDNTNDGGGWNTRLHHLTELADFGYPHLYKNFGHEHMPSLADYGAGAGTGMYFVHEPGFPGDFGDALYSGDFNTGVSIHRRKRHGESFQIQQNGFMNLPKNTGIDVDGFSRMYCASWSGGGFGFASELFGHVDLIQPKDRARAAVYPEINKASDTELLTQLASRSQVARINTMREMVTRGSKPIFSKGLLAMAEDTDTPLYARVAAVMTLKQLDGAKSHAALKGLYQDTDLREFVVRALGDVASEIDGTGKKIFLQALGDENPRVQMRAIVSLARSGDVAAATAILPLARDEKILVESGETLLGEPNSGGWSAPNRAIPHTALKAVVKLNAIDLLLSKLDDTEMRETGLRGLQEIHNEKVVSSLAAKVESTSDKQLVKLIAVALFRLYHREAPWDGKTWWGHRPNFAGPYFRCATWEHTPSVRSAIEAAFMKADPADYADLFMRMRLNQVPESELNLKIAFDEVLSFLNKPTLTHGEFTQVMNAAADKERPEAERLKIYEYFKRGPLPDSYLNRAHILRVWGEGRAEGKLQRQAYAEFVSGKEFIGKVKELEPFFKNSEKDSYKYAHLQLLNLINNKAAPGETRKSAAAELEKTWADKKNIYPHRLRGLMLAFEESDPTPYVEQLKPLVEHRDERTKQPAARFLEAIKNGTAAPSGD
ncbi:MAG: hypothetical protein CMK32_00040, partial [Porticoccaceae bacterium]|nr:hypothetical protein [Porticoccaceae bacterium]